MARIFPSGLILLACCSGLKGCGGGDPDAGKLTPSATHQDMSKSQTVLRTPNTSQILAKTATPSSSPRFEDQTGTLKTDAKENSGGKSHTAALLANKVNQALRSDKFLAKTSVVASVIAPDTIVLRGTVGSEEYAAHVAEVASTVEGIGSLKNEVLVSLSMPTRNRR